MGGISERRRESRAANSRSVAETSVPGIPVPGIPVPDIPVPVVSVPNISVAEMMAVQRSNINWLSRVHPAAVVDLPLLPECTFSGELLGQTTSQLCTGSFTMISSKKRPDSLRMG